jgi:hypothetical protein
MRDKNMKRERMPNKESIPPTMDESVEYPALQ